MRESEEVNHSNDENDIGNFRQTSSFRFIVVSHLTVFNILQTIRKIRPSSNLLRSKTHCNHSYYTSNPQVPWRYICPLYAHRKKHSLALCYSFHLHHRNLLTLAAYSLDLLGLPHFLTPLTVISLGNLAYAALFGTPVPLLQCFPTLPVLPSSPAFCSLVLSLCTSFLLLDSDSLDPTNHSLGIISINVGWRSRLPASTSKRPVELLTQPTSITR